MLSCVQVGKPESAGSVGCLCHRPEIQSLTGDRRRPVAAELQGDGRGDSSLAVPRLGGAGS
jgi:hypothetical protein